MNTLTGIVYTSASAREFTSNRMQELPAETGPLLDYRAQMVVAHRHYLDKNFALALSTYRRVLAHFPADAIALSGQAWSLYYLGDEASAATDFRTLLHANAADSWARKGLAMCERREGE